jgi:protein SCO1/2
MTTRMAKLEQSLKSVPDVHMVSFTVDPARDTPSVLAKYADEYGASRDRWFFLTGEQAALYSLATNGFRLAVIENADGTSQPDHSTRFVLVDRRARIRGYYDGLEEDAMKKLLADIQRLRREKF